MIQLRTFMGDASVSTGHVVFECSASTPRQAVELACMRGINLGGVDFSGMDLTGATLSHAKFRHACFKGANLTEAIIELCDLTGCDFTDAVLDCTILKFCRADYTRFFETSLKRAKLLYVSLYQAYLMPKSVIKLQLNHLSTTSPVTDACDALIRCGMRTDGYEFYLSHLGTDLREQSEGVYAVAADDPDADDGWRIHAGCQYFTLDKARTYWTDLNYYNQSLARESIALIRQGLQIANSRGFVPKGASLFTDQALSTGV